MGVLSTEIVSNRNHSIVIGWSSLWLCVIFAHNKQKVSTESVLHP